MMCDACSPSSRDGVTLSRSINIANQLAEVMKLNMKTHHNNTSSLPLSKYYMEKMLNCTVSDVVWLDAKSSLALTVYLNPFQAAPQTRKKCIKNIYKRERKKRIIKFNTLGEIFQTCEIWRSSTFSLLLSEWKKKHQFEVSSGATRGRRLRDGIKCCCHRSHY